MKALIILSTQRSGSTMVCDDFEGTGVLGRPSEYFIKAFEDFELGNNKSSAKLLSEVYEKGIGGNGLSAVKIMSNQIKQISSMIIDSGLVEEDRPNFAFKEYFNNYCFFRVVRKDKVSQAVSRISAKKTGIYHQSSGIDGMLGKTINSDRDERNLVINDDEINKEISKIGQEEKFLDAFIKKLDLDVMILEYEDCCKNREYLFEAGKHAQVEVSEITQRRLRKVSGNKSKEIIDKYKLNYGVK